MGSMPESPGPCQRREASTLCRAVCGRLAARGETPAAFGAPNAAAALGTPFGRRCIPAPPHGAQSAPWGPRADCVAPPSHIPDMLGRRALSSGRLAALGATPDSHHGLLDNLEQPGGAHPAADAHRDDDAFGAATSALDQRVADEPR